MLRYLFNTIVATVAVCLLFTGCSSDSGKDLYTENESVQTDYQEKSEVQTEETTIFDFDSLFEKATETTTVDMSGVDMDVTVKRDDNEMISIVIAPDFFGTSDADSIRKEVKSWGATDVMIDDSTKFVTCIMSDAAYENYISKLKEQVYKTMSDITDNKNKYPSISEINANDELTDFTVLCDSGITTEKAISAVELYLDSASYQVFSGINPQDASVNIVYKDKESGNVIDTIDTAQLVSK
jgi:hypothetical protein